MARGKTKPVVAPLVQDEFDHNDQFDQEPVNPYNLAVVNSEFQPVESSAYLTFEEVMAWNRKNADKMPPLKNVEIEGKRNGGKM